MLFLFDLLYCFFISFTHFLLDVSPFLITLKEYLFCLGVLNLCQPGILLVNVSLSLYFSSLCGALLYRILKLLYSPIHQHFSCSNLQQHRYSSEVSSNILIEILYFTDCKRQFWTCPQLWRCLAIIVHSSFPGSAFFFHIK